MRILAVRRLVFAGLILGLGAASMPSRGDLWDFLGIRRKSKEVQSLTEARIAEGLKEALDVGVRGAVAALGRSDGFLKHADVRIPLPAGLQRTEAALRALGQERLVNEFETSLNRAAEQAVPEAAEVLANSVKQMTLEDARTILSSTNTAATDYFRRTSEVALQERLLPIVQGATSRAGVTSGYKELLAKAGMDRPGILGNLGRSFLGNDNLDLDSYVTRKTLDGLFVRIAEEEIKIRENPAERTTELLRQVFGSLTK